MNIVKATRKYEAWLGEQTTVIKSDIRLKHQAMSRSEFSFFRATFYRWIQLWQDICPELAHAPRVLAVGDLHVENFGTWRDVEGRLIWGVNDFDEAAPLGYTIDLVRLAVSAILAIREGHLSIGGSDACTAILDGYHQSLLEGGRPYVLEEDHGWLRELATGELRDLVRFWKKMESLPAIRSEVSKSVRKLLERAMPEPGLSYRLFHRIAGLGSLGRVRIVAVADYYGAKIAREAKALLPSAVYWAAPAKKAEPVLCETVMREGVRCPDPFVRFTRSWIIRRLSPHCSRIELSVLGRERDELRLLFAMGWETGNIHLGSRGAVKKIRKHLGSQKAEWLTNAAKKMAHSVNQDWRAWREATETPSRPV